MRRTSQQTSKQRRRVSAGVLVFLVGYVLNLCTLNPVVHAAMLRHSDSGQSAVPEHCKQSSAAASSSAPIPPDQGTSPEPFCCELRGGNNKALASAFPQTDFFPPLLRSFVPWDVTSFVSSGPSLLEGQALHSSRPPPLYLVHAALLI